MSSLVSLHLDNVEYNADRIARLFPKCKPRNNANIITCGYDSGISNQITTVDINRNPVAVNHKLDDDRHQLMDNVNTDTHERHITDTRDKSNDRSNVGCNGNTSNTFPTDNDDSSCSRISSPFDMSDEDDESEDASSPPAIPPVSSEVVTSQHHPCHHSHNNNYHHHGYNSGHHHHQQQQQQQPQQHKRKIHKVQNSVPQYKLRDSRIIEIAGGREVFSQSRSKACRKSRIHDEKMKSLGRVWELRAKMSEDKKHENTRDITETVFSSEIKSLKHPQTISLGEY
ncbi:hypothetical protein PGB90_004432 [Kerria lacca]